MKEKKDIGKTVIRKRIFLNRNKSKYCVVHLYNFKYDMQQAYLRYCKERGQKGEPVLGASCHYEKWDTKKGGKEVFSNETGTVFLCVEECGAGIVTHELMHAILWAHKHKIGKEQYPFVIKNMKEEETILTNHTFAVTQFYKWFWELVE